MTALEGLLEFALHPALEAHQPPEMRGLGRDGVRLLVTERCTGRSEHAHFSDLPRFLTAGDLLVVNTSGTVPAELTAGSADGREFPLRLSTHLQPDLWSAEPRGTTVHTDQTVSLPEGGTATFLAPYNGSSRLWIVRLGLPENPIPYLLRHGRPIRYTYVPRAWPIEFYTTIFGSNLGSAEMPSAGRPFTRGTLRRLRAASIGVAGITLHTGVSSLESDELPYPEPFWVPAETADAINQTRQSGNRVIAVGTTVVRAVETAVDAEGIVGVRSGWTDLVVTPERGVRAVDGLLTGFHEPRSTHLAMLEAITASAHLERAYHAALEGGYLWHEFGDLHLIL